MGIRKVNLERGLGVWEAEKREKLGGLEEEGEERRCISVTLSVRVLTD